MRIAIDARMMGAGNTRGIGRYIHETIEAMRAVAPEHEYVLLQPSVRWYTFTEQLKMPSVFQAANADAVWVPHWNVPLAYCGPLVITIHDLLLLHQPSSAKASTRGPIVSWIKRMGHQLVLRNAVRRASVILVPTDTVRRDVVERFPSSANKVVVTGEGITKLPVTSNQLPVADDLTGNWKLVTGNFLFYFGSAYPHKRLDLLLDAWTKLATSHPELSLVIGGEQDVFMRRVMDEASRLNLPRIYFPGRLSDEQLSTYLAHAVAHVHPSSFEGFALPSLEALSAGCPTVVADIPLMREVLPSDGVFFFKNGDAGDMMRAIETVLGDSEAAHVAARLGGEEAARRHDWNEVAARTLHAILSVGHVR
ncbi:MAG: glycosyltransferase family 4 protein [Candidatus Uhrbacteria bacterium]|nr:glycosyltransferase family 4 protein [Candidatus Uhrbacteria bacterium]